MSGNPFIRAVKIVVLGVLIVVVGVPLWVTEKISGRQSEWLIAFFERFVPEKYQ